MSIRSERLKALFDSSNLSYQDIEKLTGVSKSSLQRYASGATAKIPFDVIEKVSSAFNVSQEYLTGWDEQKESSPGELHLTEREKRMLALFRQIPEDRQESALEVLEVFLKMRKKP